MILKSSLFMQFDKIRFGFSTKLFNYKNSPFFSNMSFEIGDDRQKVFENRKLFADKLNIDFNYVAYQHQIHSDIITYVENPGFVGDADAMYTDKKNLALAVGSADCNTIFFYDTKKEVIAAIHSGWRGTHKRIAEKTIYALQEKFSSKPENIFAYMPPAITYLNYQVGKDVSEKFSNKFVHKIGDSIYIDVTKANYTMLLNAGIPAEQIQVSNLCSFANANLFHSYRRDKENSGRAWGMIYMVK